jgi:Fe-S-cluster-containing hydrogenase component 2
MTAKKKKIALGRAKKRVIYRSRPYEATGFCNGCRSCEMACSLENDGVFNPRRSRIQVVSLGTGIDIPITCQQCEDPWCEKACPVGAIVADKKQNIVVVDEEKCVGCERCVGACPFGIIMMDPVTKKAIKCNLCNGKPACVSACPSHVLACVGDTEASEANRRRFAGLLHSLDLSTRSIVSGEERVRLLKAQEKGRS